MERGGEPTHGGESLGMPGGTFGAPIALSGYAPASLEDPFAPARRVAPVLLTAIVALALTTVACLAVSGGLACTFFVGVVFLFTFVASSVWLFRMFNGVRASRLQTPVGAGVVIALAFVPVLNAVLATAALADVWRSVTKRSAWIVVLWTLLCLASCNAGPVLFGYAQACAESGRPIQAAELLSFFLLMAATCGGWAYIVLAASKATLKLHAPSPAPAPRA